MGCCHVTGPSASSLDGPMGLCVVIGCSVLSMGPTRRRWGLRGVDGPYALSLCCQWVLCIVDGPSELSMGLRSCRLAYCFVDSPAVSSIHPLGCQWACYLVDWATVSLIRWPAVLSFDLTHRGCAVCSPHPSGEGRGMSWWMAIVGSELGPWAVEIRRWDQP